MEIIPVVDVLGGLAVWARGGSRVGYQPLRSSVTGGPQPADVVRTMGSVFGFRRFYLADLDAIEGTGNNLDVVTALVRDSGCRCMVDGGVSDVQMAGRMLRAGVAQVIVGSETLSSLEALEALAEAIPESQRVFSLDVRDGSVLSRCVALAEAGPQEAARRAVSAGFTTLIALALSRVGTGGGPDLALVAQVRRAVPAARLIAGGGVRDARDLEALEDEGVQGVLVGSALHSGALPASAVVRWRGA